jgi:hypothetical protein
MDQKKNIVHDEIEKTADGEEEQTKKNGGNDPTPSEDKKEEQNEDIDPGTKRPRMRW